VCGEPVLISNKVNIWRKIEADKSGFADTDTVAGTVRNLERWLALSASDYAQMSSLARETFRLRFRLERAAMRLREIVESAL
jgi:glycosyltransferase involved in cell wall biosynthesis